MNPDQVDYESRVRLRYGLLAFAAALLIVGWQLVQLSGPHASVNELTLDLIVANKRPTADIVGSALDMFGLLSVALLLSWLFTVSRARNAGIKPVWRWLVVGGAVLSAVLAIVYQVIVVSKAHQFATTGNQGYPEANRLFSGGATFVLPLLQNLGTLMLTIGVIWTSLNAMRVGLLPRLVGYIGVIAGALFLFPVGILVPVIQGYWLAAVAIILASRWPSGDPPAWAAGVAVAWPPSSRAAGQRSPARDPRPPRGQRRRVSSQEVLAAVEPKDKNAPSPSTSSGKRKRKRK